MDHYMIRQELNPETCRLDEEGSDAAELIVNDQNWFRIATTVQ